MDGVPGLGAGEIAPGGRTVYEFDALPAGLHLYHCHVRPLAEHIAKGLYGAFIVDPAEEREEADELVMVMNGFDTNFDRANEVYAANTIGFAYMDRPIVARKDELVRVYLVNVLEYDLINSFHLHGNLFHYYPTGTGKTPSELTDTVMLCQGQRGHPRVALPVRRQVHVPRAPVRVHRARLAGLLRGARVDGGPRRDRPGAAQRPAARAGSSGSSRCCSSSPPSGASSPSTAPAWASAAGRRSRSSRSSAPCSSPARSS